MSASDVQQLIEKYGRPAYDAALRQVWVDAVMGMVWIVVLAVLAVVLWRTWPRAKAWVEGLPGMDQDLAWGICWAGTRIVPIVVGVVAALIANGVISDLVNPQWQAIQLLLDATTAKRT